VFRSWEPHYFRTAGLQTGIAQSATTAVAAAIHLAGLETGYAEQPR